MSLPRIDIVIPTKNRHDCLRRSLPSLLHAVSNSSATIIICDQSAESFNDESVIVHHCPHLTGLPAARNFLLRVSDADVVLFLDDDTDIAPDFLQQLQWLIVHEPQLLAWGPVIETRPRAIRRLHRLSQLGVFVDPRRLTSRAHNYKTTLLFGCCFAVRRLAAIAVGFDERRSGYALGEDADFFWRLYLSNRRHCCARFSSTLRAIHRRDGHDRAQPWQRGFAKGQFLQWWARRHGGENPLTIVHLMIAAVAAASGYGQEPGQWRGVVQGLCTMHPKS